MEELGRNEPSWENLAVSFQSKGSAITPTLTVAILSVPTSQNPCMTYLSFNSITGLWGFYVSHLGIEAGCAVVSGGGDAILYHHRDNLDVLFPYWDSYLRSCFLLDPDRGQLLCLFLSPFYTYIHAYIHNFSHKAFSSELFLKTDAERIH